ncbi:glycosyltransferase family 4 protein [Candidatus Collierbacteria bacterium]|nr:glycosyltransferase family 4 protein [Candidatus Collierbacteria bacterium]
MKILTTISYYRPHVSGLTICVQRLIEGLSKKDFQFTVLTSRHRKNLLISETENNVKIIRSPVLFTLGKVPLMPWYFFQAIREIKNNDLVWINLPQAEGLIVAATAKLFGKKIITTVHCLPLLPSGLNRILFQILFDWLNNTVIRFSDKAVYYTKDYAENTKGLLHNLSKSSYILPPVIMSNEQKIMNNEKREQKFIIGFAGRIAEDKGLEYLLEALSILKSENKNVDLIIAGNMNAVGENSYIKKINNRLKEIKFKVNFSGEIDPENMFEFYRKIDLLVLPSVNRTEAFGMVQVEAMLAGVAVVASDLPGVRIPISLTGGGIIVKPRDAGALSKAISLYLEKKANKLELARKAALIFRQGKTLEDYAEIFRQTKN